MNASEQVGLTARSVVDAFKSTPVILAVLLLNLMFMGLLAWGTYTAGERWSELLTATLQACGPKR